MFDELLKGATSRFGLGDKAGDLLGMLLALITGKETGGIAGFLAKFQDLGMDDVLGSWMGPAAESKAISDDQVGSLVGSEWLQEAASKLGLGAPAISGAIGALLPGVLSKLAPGGNVPDAMPDWLAGLMPGLASVRADAVKTVADTTASATTAVRTAAESASAATAEASEGAGNMLAKVLPWLALLLLAFLAWQCLMSQKPATGTATTSGGATTTGTLDPKLTLKLADGNVNFEGIVKDEATKEAVLGAIGGQTALKLGNGDIALDANAKGAAWAPNLASLLGMFSANGTEIEFIGMNLRIKAPMAEADAAAMMEKVKGILGDGYTITMEPLALIDKGMEALNKLGDGFTAQDLVGALNLCTIHFDTGSATIQDDSMGVLRQAAGAIKKAPAGLKIEVGGHTDSEGDDAGNMTLSQARAVAVSKTLVAEGVGEGILSSKGYGETKPVADNATEEGRAKNRRMEFTLLP